jgi:hypothetical protein
LWRPGDKPPVKQSLMSIRTSPNWTRCGRYRLLTGRWCALEQDLDISRAPARCSGMRSQHCGTKSEFRIVAATNCPSCQRAAWLLMTPKSYVSHHPATAGASVGFDICIDVAADSPTRTSNSKLHQNLMTSPLLLDRRRTVEARSFPSLKGIGRWAESGSTSREVSCPTTLSHLPPE